MTGFVVVLVAAFWAAPVPAQQAPTPLEPPGQGRRPDLELLTAFDQDKNGWLNQSERAAARARVAELRPGRRGGTPPAPPAPGPRLSPADVARYEGKPLYDPSVLRTIFLEFGSENWEEELETFHRTDIDLPATATVDGRRYEDVGVQFRGNSSFASVPRGRKRSMGLALGLVNGNQRLEGYQALTLLNAHSDPTFLRSMLYLDIARQYIPTLKANYVRVVINGESWGVYVNQQRFNKDFLREAFKTDQGVRFRSSNRSRGGGLSYLGENVDDYRKWYEPQDADRAELWKPLMTMTRVLAETPPDRLRAAIEPILDVDGALRFLALDITAMGGDSYFLFGSEMNLYVDAKGRLHILHHDTNEAFTSQPTGPPVDGRASGPRDAKADPLGYMDDPFKALRHKLLAVPEYRDRYLRYVREIAEKSLDWATLEPKINAWRMLIAADVEADTRKLYTTEEFATATFGAPGAPLAPSSLKGFILERREYLLNHPAIKALGR